MRAMMRAAGNGWRWAELSENDWRTRYRAWVMWAMQSGFRLFSFSLGIGLGGGVFWGCGMWLAWNMAAWLAPHWGIPVERLNSWPGIIDLAKPSLGFGLTTAAVVWLAFLWLRGRLDRLTNSSQDMTP
jgi:hypothetical protein